MIHPSQNKILGSVDFTYLHQLLPKLLWRKLIFLAMLSDRNQKSWFLGGICTNSKQCCSISWRKIKRSSLFKRK